MIDQFNLERFIDAQNYIYDDVIQELKNGRKKTHWMWFVFPQITVEIFGSPDNMKFHSSITLFHIVDENSTLKHNTQKIYTPHSNQDNDTK